MRTGNDDRHSPLRPATRPGSGRGVADLGRTEEAAPLRSCGLRPVGLLQEDDLSTLQGTGDNRSLPGSPFGVRAEEPSNVPCDKAGTRGLRSVSALLNENPPPTWLDAEGIFVIVG